MDIKVIDAARLPYSS